MAGTINVNYGPSSIGQIIFEEAPHEFMVAYSGGGFRLTLPAKLRMAAIEVPGVIPMVSNLRGIIYGVGEHGDRLDLGEIRDDSYYIATQGEYSPALNISWSGPLKAIARCERLRNGKAPSFYVTLNGELSFLIRWQVQIPPEQFPNQFTNQLLRSVPVPIPGQTTITYPVPAWI